MGILAVCLAAAGLLQAQLFVPPGIQQERLVYRVSPAYPELAKRARIQGTVKLRALIGEDGRVERLRLIGGHPLLVKAAFDAVKQWRYRPATRNGVPAAVVTIIEVTFTLGAPFPSNRTRRVGMA